MAFTRFRMMRVIGSAAVVLAAVAIYVSPGEGVPLSEGFPFFAGNGFVFIRISGDGHVSTWGRSSSMPFGNGKQNDSSKQESPVELPGIAGAKSAAAGETFALILLSDGRVAAWGQNSYCEVGNGNSAKPERRPHQVRVVNAPVILTTIINAAQLAAGRRNAGALLSDGTVMMWGTAEYGLLGPSDLKDYECASVPRSVSGLMGIRQIAIGTDHALALKGDGTILAWGQGRSGQLGNGSTAASVNPVVVQGITNAIAVAAGHEMSMALLSDGTVRTWGFASNGALGDPESKKLSMQGGIKPRLTPYAVAGVTNVKAIAIGNGCVQVQLQDGTMRGWGEGYHGCLGNGSSAEWFDRPQTPKGLGPVHHFHMIGRTTFAVKQDGTVMVWGPLYMKTAQGYKENSTIPIPLQ